MRIGIHGKQPKGTEVNFLDATFEALCRHESEVWVSSKFSPNTRLTAFSDYNFKTFDYRDNLKFLDAFISLGGDGTLLESITYLGKNEIPILGVNMGRMGFLATIGCDEIQEAINCLFSGTYRIDARAMLTFSSNMTLFGKLNFALNDFAILKKGTSSMMKIHVHINSKLLNSYWADGVIVATPTGSTGYSLSCGGPLLFPNSKSFVITPVSPHNLTARPIVVPDDSEITLQIEGRNKEALVALDSRFNSVNNEVKMKIEKSEHRAQLIQMSDQYYLKTLRQKLNWGLDIRN